MPLLDSDFKLEAKDLDFFFSYFFVPNGKKHSEYVIWVNLKLYDLLMTSPNLLNVQLWRFEVPLPTVTAVT